MATEEQEQQLDQMLNQIRANTLELIDKRYSKPVLVTAGIKRGKKLLNGKLSKQDVIDIGAIGLSIMLS